MERSRKNAVFPLFVAVFLCLCLIGVAPNSMVTTTANAQATLIFSMDNNALAAQFTGLHTNTGHVALTPNLKCITGNGHIFAATVENIAGEFQIPMYMYAALTHFYNGNGQVFLNTDAANGMTAGALIINNNYCITTNDTFITATMAATPENLDLATLVDDGLIPACGSVLVCTRPLLNGNNVLYKAYSQDHGGGTKTYPAAGTFNNNPNLIGVIIIT